MFFGGRPISRRNSATRCLRLQSSRAARSPTRISPRLHSISTQAASTRRWPAPWRDSRSAAGFRRSRNDAASPARRGGAPPADRPPAASAAEPRSRHRRTHPENGIELFPLMQPGRVQKLRIHWLAIGSFRSTSANSSHHIELYVSVEGEAQLCRPRLEPNRSVQPSAAFSGTKVFEASLSRARTPNRHGCPRSTRGPLASILSRSPIYEGALLARKTQHHL